MAVSVGVLFLIALTTVAAIASKPAKARAFLGARLFRRPTVLGPNRFIIKPFDLDQVALGFSQFGARPWVGARPQTLVTMLLHGGHPLAHGAFGHT